jgi:hypothetical protein
MINRSHIGEYKKEDTKMTDVFIRVKSVAKRKPALEPKPYSLPDATPTLSDLIAAVVRIEVERYNTSADSGDSEATLLPFLTESQIDEQSATGKVGFGRIYSDRKADYEQAVLTAVQGFEDGLFRVIINDTQVESLDSPVNLKNGDTLTFVRLTFLSGRLW